MFFRKTTFSLVTARFMRLARSLIVYPIFPDALGSSFGLKTSPLFLEATAIGLVARTFSEGATETGEELAAGFLEETTIWVSTGAYRSFIRESSKWERTLSEVR